MREHDSHHKINLFCHSNLETQTNKQKLPLCTTLTTNGKIRGNFESTQAHSPQ